MKKITIIACLSMFYTSMNAQTTIPADVKALLDKNNCTSCHKVDKKAIGPSWTLISEKQYTVKKFTELVYKPVPENWPTYTPAMAALPKTPKADLKTIAVWVNALTKK